MAPQNRKTGWGRHLLYGAGLLALLLLLAPAWAGAVDLVVDGGATSYSVAACRPTLHTSVMEALVTSPTLAAPSRQTRCRLVMCPPGPIP
ncbi:MAG: hypothetical protein P8X58_09030 [Syntrophobacterales bacterium]